MKPHMIDPPKKTWFWERLDGSIIATEGTEAWGLYRDKKFKLVGVGDGKIFNKAVVESHDLFKDEQRSRDYLGEEACKDLKPQEILQLAVRNCLLKGEKDEIAAAMGKIEIPPDTDWVGAKPE